MQVLITNDDGIYAPGIQELIKEFNSAGHSISVVAPDREQSAVGHGITLHSPLRLMPRNITGVDTAYAVNGTPADCVKLALENLLIDNLPDLVVSGINRGPNLGTDVIYSGTVSGAVEAAILGVPAIAVSLAGFQDIDYKVSAKFSVHMAKQMKSHPLPPDTLLNINIPAVKLSQIKGICSCKLGKRKYDNTFLCREDPSGRKYYWMAGELKSIENDPDTDVVAIANNFITITPIHFDLTNYALIDQVKSWNLELK